MIKILSVYAMMCMVVVLLIIILDREGLKRFGMMLGYVIQLFFVSATTTYVLMIIKKKLYPNIKFPVEELSLSGWVEAIESIGLISSPLLIFVFTFAMVAYPFCATNLRFRKVMTVIIGMFGVVSLSFLQILLLGLFRRMDSIHMALTTISFFCAMIIMAWIAYLPKSEDLVTSTEEYDDILDA